MPAAAAPIQTTTRPTSRLRRRIHMNSSAAASACSVTPPSGWHRAARPASTSTSSRVLSISLDHPTLSFPAAVPGTTPSALPEARHGHEQRSERVHARRPPDGLLAARPAARHRSRQRQPRSRADRAGAGPVPGGNQRPERRRGRHGCDERRVRLAAARRPGRPLHGDADVHGDRQVRRALVALILATAAASIPGAAAGGGIGLSASPLRLTLRGASTAAITVRNPGRRPLLVDVSRAGFARSLHGKPQVRSARGVAGWLRLRPRRIRLARARRPSSTFAPLLHGGRRPETTRRSCF